MVVAVLLAACGEEAPQGDPEPEDPLSQEETRFGELLLHPLDASSWRRSVRDLLWLDATPEVALPDEPTLSGFEHTLGALQHTDLHLELLDAATEAVLAALDADPDHPSRVRLLPCAAEAESCHRAALGAVVGRAWRVPNPLDLGDDPWPEAMHPDRDPRPPFEAIAGWMLSEASPTDPWPAFSAALRAVLLSPRFLFRVEARGLDPSAQVDDWELAARLAFFLWKSVPDAALRAAAASGSLQEASERVRQARRMLADPRAEALVDDFAGQWLGLRGVEEARPQHPAFSPIDGARERTHASMRAELRWLFLDRLTRDAPVGDLFRGEEGWVDAELAPLYGLAAVDGPGVVSLPEARRGGWLTTVAWLATTGRVFRTSPTGRGLWIVDRLFCDPLGSPPPGVEGLNEFTTDFGDATIREIVEQATAAPACQACHARMDPYGFAFEAFNSAGEYRAPGSEDADTRVSLPTGQHLDGGAAVAQVIAGDPRLTRCFSQQLATYSVGLVPDDEVLRDLHAAAEQVATDGGGMLSLVEALAASAWFGARVPEDVP